MLDCPGCNSCLAVLSLPPCLAGCGISASYQVIGHIGVPPTIISTHVTDCSLLSLPKLKAAAPKAGVASAQNKPSPPSWQIIHTDFVCVCVCVCVCVWFCGFSGNPQICVFTLPCGVCLAEGAEDLWVKVPSSRKPSLNSSGKAPVPPLGTPLSWHCSC